MVSPVRGAKEDLYRVRVGPFATREEASRASGELTRKEKVKTWIVPPGE
jgi:cell division septation protein DedD